MGILPASVTSRRHSAPGLEYGSTPGGYRSPPSSARGFDQLQGRRLASSNGSDFGRETWASSTNFSLSRRGSQPAPFSARERHSVAAAGKYKPMPQDVLRYCPSTGTGLGRKLVDPQMKPAKDQVAFRYCASSGAGLGRKLVDQGDLRADKDDISCRFNAPGMGRKIVDPGDLKPDKDDLSFRFEGHLTLGVKREGFEPQPRAQTKPAKRVNDFARSVSSSSTGAVRDVTARAQRKELRSSESTVAPSAQREARHKHDAQSPMHVGARVQSVTARSSSTSAPNVHHRLIPRAQATGRSIESSSYVSGFSRQSGFTDNLVSALETVKSQRMREQGR